jgi:Tfp pilus assembly protein PilN
MSTPFQINFRREAFRRERAEARRRVFGLGVWLAYFGTLAVLLGLYGLNCAALGDRTRLLQRQIERQHALNHGAAAWVASANDAAAVEPWVTDAARWRDLLGRLPRLLPAGARLTSLQWNPDDVSGGERKLLLFGVLRVDGKRDRMAGVTDIVGVLSRDSLFAAHFHSVRLLATRTHEGSPDAEFQLECK